jgi:NADH-quinone oxidoreductase subunit E
MPEGNGVFPPEDLKERFDTIVERYPQRVAALIPLLMILQENYRRISKEHMEGLAEYLDCTAAHVLGVTTFYTMLSQKERGEHHVYICKTLSCHLRGAPAVRSAFEERLGVRANSGEVSQDGRFSLDDAECLGLCEMAPCILVGERRYGNLTPESVENIVKELLG